MPLSIYLPFPWLSVGQKRAAWSEIRLVGLHQKTAHLATHNRGLLAASSAGNNTEVVGQTGSPAGQNSQVVGH